MAAEVILVIEDDVHIGGLVVQVLREADLRPRWCVTSARRATGRQRGEHARGRAQRSHGRRIGRSGAADGGARGDLPGRAARADDGRAATPPRGARRHARADHRKTVRARSVDSHYPQHDRGTAAMKVVPGAAGFVATAAGRPAAAAARARDRQLRRRPPRTRCVAGRGARARRPAGRSVRGVDVHPPPRPPVRARPGAAADHVAGAPARAAAPRRESTSRSSSRSTRAFAAIEAPAFVRDVLARNLGARDAVVGYDFSFGRGRAGNAQMLGASSGRRPASTSR